MFQETSQKNYWKFPEIFLDISWKFPQNFHEIFLEKSWKSHGDFPDMSRKCPRYFPEISQKFSGNVPAMFQNISGRFPEVFPTCSRQALKNLDLFWICSGCVFLLIFLGVIYDFCYGHVPLNFRKFPGHVLGISGNVLDLFRNMSANFQEMSRKTNPDNSKKSLDISRTFPRHFSEHIPHISQYFLGQFTRHFTEMS